MSYNFDGNIQCTLGCHKICFIVTESWTKSRACWNQSNEDVGFLKNAITSETWAYWYDVEIKAHSLKLVEKLLQKLKTMLKSLKCKSDVDHCFWNNVIHYECVPYGQTFNKEFYLEIIQHLRKAVRKKRPEAWADKTF